MGNGSAIDRRAALILSWMRPRVPEADKSNRDSLPRPLQGGWQFVNQWSSNFKRIAMLTTMSRPILACLVIILASSAFADDSISFNRDVRPILSNHCIACHGPDEEHREADTRLDVAGEADLEAVLERITSDDPDVIMPPPDLHKPLKPEQVTTLKNWIAQGAEYEQHWSFASPKRTKDDPATTREAIDHFVMARLRSEGLQPSPRASRRTLIRRVSFDLTGLPPTRDEIQTFVNDASTDAYDKLVDRLLAKPQYGEHMARYWLDLVRFSDTNGLHHDHYRDMTPYRDWVIRSFNNNLPYDKFLAQQLAGDLYEQPTTDQLIASGFNRLHLIIDRGTALPEESFHRNVIDRVTAVGTAFMGLTVQCATCHDHKYDPITQKDFYQLYAFFNNFDGGPETGGRRGTDFRRGLQKPYIDLPTADQTTRLEELNAKVQETTKAFGQADRALKVAQQAKRSDAIKQLTADLNAAKATRDKATKERDALLMQIPAAMVMRERAEVRPTHIMVRGQYDSPGDLVERNTPNFLPPMKSATKTKSRMDLANWFIDPTNPLTARVAANRFWQQFSGVGLVSTAADLGAQGEVPSHPELLDQLAIGFVESGWNIKKLVRSIVLSQTYQQRSIADRGLYSSDPANRLLARGSRFRLDAEVIRDQLLSVTGLLNPQMHGRSVKPPQPAGIWELVAMPSSYPRVYKADSGDKIYRRSIYTFWKRAIPPPQMTIFDAPTREACIARRERTNTPLQALLLMNEQEYFRAAMHYAGKLLEKDTLTDEQRVSEAFETVTSHEPTPGILRRLTKGLNDFRSTYQTDQKLRADMIGNHAKREVSPGEQAELCAWTMLVHSLLNLDTTRTHE
ncbi:MAG: DUF1553 domain-containing protein [Planctomycetaceae bacterium]